MSNIDAEKLRSFIERADNADTLTRADERFRAERYMWNERHSILAMAEELARKDAEIARLQEVEDRAWREARELVIGSNADLGGGSGRTYRRIISGLTAAIHNRELRTLSGRVADLIARRALCEEKS